MSAQVKDALQELTTIGSVGLDRCDVDKPACGYEYTVNFAPMAHHTLPHILNYGDLPDIVVRGTERASGVEPQPSNTLNRFSRLGSSVYPCELTCARSFCDRIDPPLFLFAPSCALCRWRRRLL